MARAEAQTDIWVSKLLDDARIDYEYQSSTVLEIDKALKTASKRGTGNAGYPEFTAVVNGFVLVIEDKASLANHIRRNELELLDMRPKAVCDYAANGAVFYAKHIARNSSFKRVFAIAVSGDKKLHRITPYFVNDREGYDELEDIDTFASFTKDNIFEYYTRYVLHETPDEEKTTEQILANARELHEYLYRYGALGDSEKALIVSGILLALDEISVGNFSIDSLTGDSNVLDGEKISRAIEDRLKRSNVSPENKRDKLMAEFSLFRTNTQINTPHSELRKTPLRFYTEYLYKHVFNNIKAKSSSEDYIGRFYGEFVSYSGTDGHSLGVVLTPKHICDLFCEIVQVKPTDVVLDPCCGSAAFLVAAMHHMFAQTDASDYEGIRTQQLHGFELRNDMFAIAVTNMILRDDGNSNILQTNFITEQIPSQVQVQKMATVGMMNPPYSQGSVSSAPDLFELNFVKLLLDCLVRKGRAVVIVPQSAVTNSRYNLLKALKAEILRKHTLEGVITCNNATFTGVATDPVIAVFTAHIPHPKDKKAKFIDFRQDGYTRYPHVGLIETDDAVDKKAHLLSVWQGKAEALTSFCVESTVEPDDEWLHSFYYFNDAVPTDDDFALAFGDYLAFEFAMVMKGKASCIDGRYDCLEYKEVASLDSLNWQPIYLSSLFKLERGKENNMTSLEDGDLPLISARNCDNGLKRFVSGAKHVFPGNVITLNNDGDGGAGLAYYQPMEMALDSHVTALIPRKPMSWLSQLFIARCISTLHGFFGHGRSISKPRANRTRVMLPVDESGTPDYAYMEQYTQNVLLAKCQEYKAFFSRYVREL